MPPGLPAWVSGVPFPIPSPSRSGLTSGFAPISLKSIWQSLNRNAGANPPRLNRRVEASSFSPRSNENRERQPLLAAEAVIDGRSKTRYWAAAIGEVNTRVAHKVDKARHTAVSAEGIARVDRATDYVRWLATDIGFGLPSQGAKLGGVRVFELLQYSILSRYEYGFVR